MALDADNRPSELKAFLVDYFTSKDVFVSQTEERKEGQKEMKRHFNLFQLTMLGVAAIIGAGIFVVTGLQAKNNAGPGIMISYGMAGTAATIQALCFAEFATEFSVTGGTIIYNTTMFGKAVGWFIAVNVLLEYILATASVAIGFTGYFASLIGLDSNYFSLMTSSGTVVNPLAAGLIILISILLVCGVKETFWLNTGTVVLCLFAIFISIFAGAAKVDRANYTKGGFLPYGFSGVFTATSSVFFAYIGFDMISQGAEEAKNPKRDIPLAVVISTIFCTTLYVAMATIIVGMVYYPDISSAAPFSDAFSSFGWEWASKIVAIGACCGTFNTVLVDLFGLQRILVVLGRANLLPGPMAAINPKTQTPLWSGGFSCIIAAILAFVVPLSTLADAVSMGTLVAFSFVCQGVVWRARYQGPGCGTPLWKVLVPTIVVYASAIACGFSYGLTNGQHFWAYLIPAGTWLLGACSFYFVPIIYKPTAFTVPLNPILPCFGMACSIFLVGTLSTTTWKVWAYAQAAGLGLYIVNGVYQYYFVWRKAPKDVEGFGGKGLEYPAVGKVTAEMSTFRA